MFYRFITQREILKNQIYIKFETEFIQFDTNENPKLQKRKNKSN